MMLEQRSVNVEQYEYMKGNQNDVGAKVSECRAV